MDPHLLVGLVNTALRNHCVPLMTRTHELESDALIKRLQDAGYEYQPAQNQFR